jgi:hypothetical protein
VTRVRRSRAKWAAAQARGATRGGSLRWSEFGGGGGERFAPRAMARRRWSYDDTVAGLKHREAASASVRFRGWS